MISLSQFKANLLVIMRLMIKNPGMYMDVVYKGNLYRVTFEDMHQEVVQRRRPRRQSLVEEVKARKCPECKKLMLNGVCMNSLCPTNAKKSLTN